MRIRKTGWRKRILAVILATSMLVTMTPAALAEDGLNQPVSAASGILEEEAEAAAEAAGSENNVADDSNTDVFIDDAEEPGENIQNGNDASVEEVVLETDSASEMETNETTGDESAEGGTEAETGTEDLMEDEAEIELCLNLLGEDVSTSNAPQTPTLTLEAAINLAETYKSGNELTNAPIVKQDDKALKVYDGAGLIFLSNVFPADYADLNIILITTQGWDVTRSLTITGQTYDFLGLGVEDSPYAGAFSIDTTSSTYSIKTSKSLFNALSTKASLSSLSFNITADNSVIEDPLLTKLVKTSEEESSLQCQIILKTTDFTNNSTIGGIIGALNEEVSAAVTLTNNLSGTLTVKGETHTGLFCNTMKSGSSLAVNFVNSGNATIDVKATENKADAGGFVGYIGGKNTATTTLTISGNSVTSVSSEQGNAGGLVGSAIDTTINLSDGLSSFALSSVNVSAGNNDVQGGSVGGLVGDYTYDGTETLTLNLKEFYSSDISINFSNGEKGNLYTGGVFGVFRNNGSYSICGNAVISTLTGSGISVRYGGLIGTYSATTRSAALNISNADAEKDISITSTGGNNATTYGGVIGTVSGSSYVAIDNVSVSTAAMPTDSSSYFGGLVGKMEDGLLNVGNVTLTTTDSNDISADHVGGRGGLVGAITKGVLRLHGTTDLSGQKITAAYYHTGQIVGNNGNGLVYAVGDGSGHYGGETSADAWTLKRYNDASRSGSDIGNWGEVVRLDGSTLTEGDGGLLTFDSNAHTVTVQGADVTTGDDGTQSVPLTGTRDFAAYALAFNCNSSTDYPTDSSSTSTLIFNSLVDWTATQTVTLGGEVNLQNTGILGIGKDDNTQTFTGTFDGGCNTITLGIGGKYGNEVTENSGNGSGQIYASRISNHDAHYALALFPKTSNATIKNFTVGGSVNVVATAGSNNWPGYAAAVVGSASGDTSFDSVIVNSGVTVTATATDNLEILQAGILGQYADGDKLTFKNCKWTSSSFLINNRTNDKNYIGGFVGRVLGDSNVTVSGGTIGGSIESSATSDAWVGGLIAESRSENFNNGNYSATEKNNEITISNLTVSGANIRAASEACNCGGLLGYSWSKTDVTFVDTGSTGVTISGCTLNASSVNAETGNVVSKATFGGLVYQATGYWNATAANSIKFTKTDDGKINTFSGKSDSTNISGLLVGTGLITSNNQSNALYLEVGTWGSEGAAYYIEPNSVMLTLGGSTASSNSYFDELVGTTIKDNKGNDNAVVSLAVRESNGTTAAKIDPDKSTCNTYKGQIANYQNGKTRYYYNLDSYRNKGDGGKSQVNAGNLTTSEEVLSWSVSQYAASNINTYFCVEPKTPAFITGDIKLTGYSYYPVSPLGTVTVGSNDKTTTLTFAYEEMNGKETSNSNKPFNGSNQHYLMLYGLLYDTANSVTVNNTTFVGTVGQLASNGGSGALIFGSVIGDPNQNPVEVTLKNVTLAGLRIAGVEKGTTTYAPLLINEITKVAKLTVTNLSTGEGYSAGTYAATSLIGNVGSSSAIKLTLTFSNIALDGRLEKDESSSISVYNNGKHQVDYHTTHTVFTNATLLESFLYKSEGSGTYNFNSTDDKVTYGVELSNSGTTGRNPDKQYQYYDNEDYVTDENGTTKADADYVKERYAGTHFIRYVHVQQNVSENKYELDINQKTTGLLEGCGTYGDPYIIKDPSQMISLANYINDDTRSSTIGFEVVFNSKVLQEKKQTLTSYHTSGKATTGDTGTDTVYTWNGSNWKNTSDETADATIALQYLQNAYYQIQGEITLPADKFAGLGTLVNPFSGVIVGENNNTVSIIGINEEKTNFSGLVRYSRGSVVKDLTVDYTGAKITMSNDDVPNRTNNPFFGGVVGYCMGGDTIIDNVSVTYGENSVRLSGNNGFDRLIAAGGYVGLVGGAKSDTYTTEYEKNGGGVVFREMEGKSDPFEGDMATNSDAVSNYFYCNPFVGRVLDGYACYEGGTEGKSTINNTDKNYTIPDVPTTGGLTVTQASDGPLTATVTSAQGLWLLSAIVNSGAGAMDSTGTYLDYENRNYVEAYQYGKPRTGKYDLIGKDGGENDLADEAYWGGINSTANTDQAKARVSFLVKKCDSNSAAQLTGRSGIINKNGNNLVSLTFGAAEIDMRSYKNGFRGIGGSYGEKKIKKEEQPKAYRRSLRASRVSGTGTGTTIYLAMDQHDYEKEYTENNWSNQGAGLFTVFMYTGTTANPCLVEKVTISGTVSARTYDLASGKELGIKKVNSIDVGVGGFASRLGNSHNEALKFDNFHLTELHVTGGTATGGAIGLVTRCGTVEFNNWSIKDSTVYKWVNNDGSTGGLIGWLTSLQPLKINGYGHPSEQSSDRLWNVEGLSVTVLADDKQYGNIGGLTGANDESDVSITEVNIKGMTVRGIAARDVGGLADGGGNKITVKNCWLEDIAVSGETNSNNKSSGSVGGVLGFCNNSGTTIENVTITGNSSVKSSGSYVGGLVGEAKNAATVKNCHITGSSDRQPILVCNSGSSYAGGLIGKSNNNITISDCTETYLNILANGNDAAGLIGKMEGTNVATKASNVVFSHVIVAAKASGKSIGLLTGYIDSGSNARNIYGYNILADSCKLGWNNSSGISINTLADTELNTTGNTGLWLGGIKAQDHKLVAVAVKGTNQLQNDVGSIVSGGSVQITYADYPVNQNNQPQSGTASPWLDVNPKSDVILGDNTVMTGNGVGYIEDKSIAKTILDVAKTDNTKGRTYWKVKDESEIKNTFSKYLDPSNDVYLTTYRDEEKTTTAVSPEIDFPLLVVNNTADVDAMIWDYIAALTNVAAGSKAKEQVTNVECKTYKWKELEGSEEGKFELQSSPSLSVDKSNTIKITPSAYDNQISQFTLLDVQYDDPTDSGSNVFHLYIPVLVKKVLEISFDAKFLAGTNYNVSSYVDKAGTSDYATAGFDEPVTAYIEYGYDEDTKNWQLMLDNGDNLLWYYDKVLNLASEGDRDDEHRLLPVGTRLTLVDRQTEQYYTCTLEDGIDDTSLHTFDLSQMVAQDDTTYFNPVYICDLLDLTVSEPVTEIETGKTYYVEASKEDATIRKDDKYYRKAQDTEEGNKYIITVNSIKCEGYYLTIQIPKKSGYSVVNNRLNFCDITRKAETLPAKITSDPQISGSSYVIYDGVQQTFEITETSRVHNGKKLNDKNMENGDSVYIKLTSILSLTPEGAKRFELLGPSELYHQFDINMKKYLKKETGENTVIGADTVSYSYQVKNNSGMIIAEKELNKDHGSQALDILTIQYGSDDMKIALESGDVKITADITFTYTTVGDYFPARVLSDEQDDSGISVIGTSRVANVASQLPITSTKSQIEEEQNKRYYTTNPSKASLTFFTVDGAGVGDTTQQLGINPLDEVNSLGNVIYTEANYDYSGVDTANLTEAKTIKYTLELFRKQDDGSYAEANPLGNINTYLQTIQETGGSSFTVSGDGASMSLIKPFSPDTGQHEFEKIHFTPLTGDAFQNENFYYANYKVKLTAVLLNGSGEELAGTKASDYIIYTNARIYQQMINPSADAEAGDSAG